VGMAGLRPGNSKPGEQVDRGTAALEGGSSTAPRSSRAGTRLAPCADAFGVDPAGSLPSTLGGDRPGLTDVLLQARRRTRDRASTSVFTGEICK